MSPSTGLTRSCADGVLAIISSIRAIDCERTRT